MATTISQGGKTPTRRAMRRKPAAGRVILTIKMYFAEKYFRGRPSGGRFISVPEQGGGTGRGPGGRLGDEWTTRKQKYSVHE